MSAKLNHPLERWIAVSAAALVSALLAFTAIPIWRADALASRHTENGWARAAELEPGNGEYWYDLGLFHRLDFDHADLRKSIAELQRALTDDPRSAYYWIDLGDTYEAVGDAEAARDAFQNAHRSFPASGEVHWRFGNFLLRQGQNNSAFAEIHSALVSDPRLTELAISRIWRATNDEHALLDSVLPNTDAALTKALEFFGNAGETDAAMAAWQKIVAAARPEPLKLSFTLIDLLANRQRSSGAAKVWSEALRLNGARSPDDESLIFDGGFEADSANGGLDWRLQPEKGFAYEYDASVFHSGKRALRINFDGTQNLDFQQIWQRVPVKPSTRYQFAAWLRTAAISTDSGIRFEIRQDGKSAPSFLFDGLTGDHDWTAEQNQFTTAPDTYSLVVIVRRTLSRKFDNQISGTAWIDDVSLVPANSPAKKP
jgi:tetratricopeptide (TPR) repeat protein